MNARRAESLVFTGIREAQVKTIDVAAPAAGELRLKTLACGICWREIHVFTGRLERSFPCVMGHEPVGIVDEVGPGVRGFKAGDRVTAIGQASLAEYCLVEDKYTAPISTNGEAANYLGEPVMCALAALRQANPRDDSLVVVNGVGFMGQLLMQALARRTKSQLVAVDINYAALERAAQFTGCETLTPAELTPETLKRRFGRLADIVFEASGVKGTIFPATRCVRNGGKLCLFGHHFSVEPEAVNDWHLRGIAVLNTVPWGSPDLARDFRDAVEMLNAGEFDLQQFVSHQAPLADAISLMNVASTHSPGFIKGVINF